MTADDLTSEERVEVQTWYIHAWRARRKRAEYDALRLAPARATYDVSGRLIAQAGFACERRMSTFQEDRA